jgi:hypothetical protein
MAGKHDSAKTFEDWAVEVGRDCDALDVILERMARRNARWETYMRGRSVMDLGVDLGKTISGTAQAGDVAYITLQADQKRPEDYYRGWTLRTTGGKGAGQTVVITGYANATNQAAATFAVAPDVTTTYVIGGPLASLATAIANGLRCKQILSGEAELTPAEDLLEEGRRFV